MHDMLTGMSISLGRKALLHQDLGPVLGVCFLLCFFDAGSLFSPFTF